MPGRAPLLRAGDLFAVRVIVNGAYELNMLVDTGSAFTLIAEDWAEEFRFRLEPPLRSVGLATVERLAGPLILGRLGSLQVGGALVRGIEAGLMRLPDALRVDGILGLSFLRSFRVTFEFDSSMLVLREPPPAGRASR